MIGRSLVAALTAVVTLALITPALAHAHLSSAVPAPDTEVRTPPSELLLQFTEAVEPDFTDLAVTRDGVVVPHRPAVLDAADPSAISVGFEAPLKPGTYTIDWHAVASDGHKSGGNYSFTVAP